MSLRMKLEKTAKSVSRIGSLVGKTLNNLLPISNSNVFFNVIDDQSYTLQIEESTARVIEGKASPITLELRATKEAFEKWFNGEKSFESCWVNGEIEIVNARNSLLKALMVGMLVGM
ncbi:MAG: hypothetical protein ACTSRB_07085 [Candidatus Helarchaeota archaeon]